MNSRHDHFDVIISGIGPGGLATAFEALKSGKSVLIISDRPPGFLRVQNVLINCAYRSYLRRMLSHHSIELKSDHPEDQKFLTMLDGHLGLGIKDIERFIMRRLEALNQNGNLKVLHECSLAHVDMKSGLLKVATKTEPSSASSSSSEEGMEFSFTYLIGADGVNRHALKVLCESGNIPAETLIGRIEGLSEYISPHHVTAHMAVRRKDGKKLVLPDKYGCAVCLDDCLSIMRLQREVYDSITEERDEMPPLKLTFVGELPAGLYDEMQSQRDKLFDYVHQAIMKIFNSFGLQNGELIIELTKPSKKYGEKKDRLKLTAFEFTPIECHLPMFDLDGRVFLQVGDALMNHHYLMGSGLMTALDRAMSIGSIFRGILKVENYGKLASVEFSQNRSGYLTFFQPGYDKNKFAEEIELHATRQQRLIATSRGRGACSLQ